MAIAITLYGGQAFAQESDTRPKEEDYYTIARIPVPEGIVLEGGGVCNMPNGNIAVATRRGDIYLIEDPSGVRPVYRKFASGLHEILGLRYYNGSFYCAQRSELTKITDRNGDGIADRYETVCSWPLTGNYHEYSYGPVIDDDGFMYVTGNVGFFNPEWWRGQSKAPWRGWAMQISPNGDMEPFATGMRSPCGIGMVDGELFVADNQGDWIGSGSLVHVEKGDFLGHPAGLAWADRAESPVNLTQEQLYAKRDPRLSKEGEVFKPENIEGEEVVSFFSLKEEFPAIKPPAVWLPHGILGTSNSEIVVDKTGGKFGPFQGQVFVGDQGQSIISRVFLEKINGVYQGASFLFREGFRSGVLRMTWGKDHAMYVGETNRGWGSTGPESYAFERVEWTGKTPFEMKAIRAKPDGFEIEFTKPVDMSSASELENYEISSFIYKYHPVYGSPAVNIERNFVLAAIVSDDHLKVRLVVDNLRLGHIHELKVSTASADGGLLLHNTGYYTLNNLPEGKKIKVKKAKRNKEESKAFKTPTKGDKTAIERSALGQQSEERRAVDMEIQLGTLPGLKYDKELIEAKAGSRIKITFSNVDDMPHNMLIVQPGTANKVGETALQLGLKGMEMDYVPEMKEVLFHTRLLQPGESDSIYIQVPDKTGDYQYLCTYPGHYISMRGILRVVD